MKTHTHRDLQLDEFMKTFQQHANTEQEVEQLLSDLVACAAKLPSNFLGVESHSLTHRGKHISCVCVCVCVCVVCGRLITLWGLSFLFVTKGKSP